MENVELRMRFSERIRWLIQRHTRFGGTGVVPRPKVEEIGDELGMSKVMACEEFLALQGSLWDMYNDSIDDSIAFNITKSTATNRLEPGRRWLAIKDVIVL
jgi:hypothetical protein